MEEILMKKALAALSALVLATVSLFSNANVFAAEYYDMTVTVDMQSAGKPISPYIYGINQYGIRAIITRSLSIPFGKAATE